MTTITVTSSGDWGGSYSAYDNNDIILDGTNGTITVSVVPTNYGSYQEGNDGNSPFHSPTLTIEGDVVLTGNGFLNINSTVTNNGDLTIETTNFAINGTLTGNSVTIANGGSLTVGTLKAAVTFGQSPSDATAYNTLTVTNYASSGTLTLNNLSPRDKIIFDNGQTTSLHWGSDGTTIVD